MDSHFAPASWKPARGTDMGHGRVSVIELPFYRRSVLDSRTMETKRFTWLEREFVELCGQTRPAASVEEQTAELLRRFDQELKDQSLSLENSVRITVWGRDRAARTAATLARGKVFSGANRVASSSFITAARFDSPGDAALELLVLKPLEMPALREPVDFTPARNYLRYLRCDSWLFFSGFTSEAATLELQVADILGTLQNAFSHARTDSRKVVKLSVFLQRGQDWNAVRDALIQPLNAGATAIDCRFVDGFAGEKYLLEVEATALA